MREYELYLVIDGEAEEEEANAIVERVTKLIEAGDGKSSGQVTETKSRGRRRLAYAIKKKVITLVLCLVLLVAGAVSFATLGRLEDPEFTIKDAKVVTMYPGARPSEVEQEVTDIVETAIQQLPQLKRIESISEQGQSILTPKIKDQYDKHSLPQVWDLDKANDLAIVVEGDRGWLLSYGARFTLSSCSRNRVAA